MKSNNLMTELDLLMNYYQVLADLKGQDISKLLQVGNYELINVDEVIPELRHSIDRYTYTVRLIKDYGQYKNAYIFILKDTDKDLPLFKKVTPSDFRTISRAMTQFELDHGADKELIKLHFDVATYRVTKVNHNKSAIQDRYRFTYQSALQHKQAHDTKMLKAGMNDNTSRKDERSQRTQHDFRAYRK